MRKALLILFLLPLSGYGQEITITQSQKIDLKLPTREQPVQNPYRENAKGLLIVGAAISAAGMGVGLSGSAARPAQDKVLRIVGTGIIGIGAGFTIAGIKKLK